MIDPANLYLDPAKRFRAVLALALIAAGCAAPEPSTAPAPNANAPAIAPEAAQAAREAERVKLEAQARAMLAQAETDVQRARAKRALWLKAWEDLLAARKDIAGNAFAAAIGHAKSASELAQLGLEQLAYPAVK